MILETLMSYDTLYYYYDRNMLDEREKIKLTNSNYIRWKTTHTQTFLYASNPDYTAPSFMKLIL